MVIRDLVERQPVEQHLHVAHRVDGDPAFADLAERQRRVGVVAHQGRKIEGGGEAGLPLLVEVLEALVGLGSRAEAGEHPHGPEPAAIHGGLHAPGEGVFARQAELAAMVHHPVERRHQIRDLQIAPGGQSRCALRDAPEGVRHQALAPGGDLPSQRLEARGVEPRMLAAARLPTVCVSLAVHALLTLRHRGYLTDSPTG
jgi:hypothetical protein